MEFEMSCRKTVRAWTAALLAALAFLLPLPAQAAVEMTFYAREFGSQFPHGFVTLAGTPDRGGDRIDANYGFTATAVTPAILFGSVRGKIDTAGAGYVRGSEAHFALTLSDSEYDQVMATVARYQALRQPSYSLNRRNCVHFLADIATAVGLRAEVPRSLARRPGAFLASVIRTNREALAQRPGARILREPRPERAERRSRRERD
ncbi:MAG: hypothetical protein QOC65_1150 [Sphingomonadales bacterium]|nr:hypothetical protein [Sphingomonadales bacterium]